MRDSLLTILLAGVLVTLVNPMHFWMPTSVHMLVLALLVGVVGVMLAFFVRETGGDERDEAHRATAGRVAFFLGSAVLITGIVVQGVRGDIDPWLAAALFAMIAGKVIAHRYNELNA